jgi:ribosomal protein L29
MSKRTWNRFKNEINAMNREEQEEYLKELNANRMVAETRRFQNANTMDLRMLKKKIACLKTKLGS